MSMETSQRSCEFMKKLILAICGMLLVMLSASCEKKDTEKVEVIRPVRTMRIDSPSAIRNRTFSGTLKSSVEPKLSFRVEGTIDTLPVKIGMKVKKGELIARIDPTDYELEVKQTLAQLAKAKAQYNKARDDYERNKQLYEIGNISSSELEHSLASFRTGKAEVEATEKALQLARQRLAYCTLRAPLSGFIASVPVEVHQTVKSGEIIATLAVGGKMEMEIGMPEMLINQVKAGSDASIVFDAVPGEKFAAVISEVGVELTESTTYPVKLQLLQEDSRLRSGMVGEARLGFTAGNGEEFVTVPAVAVISSSDGRKSVWKYRPDADKNNMGTVTRQDIEVGGLTSSGIIVQQGIQAGDIIVIRGVHRLSDGMRVRLLESDKDSG